MGVTKKIKSQGISRQNTADTHQSGGRRRTNQATINQEEAKQQIWQVLTMIPKGQVASYGQIAKLIGYPSHSRFVGRTLANLPKDTKLPWYRVVNSTLRISQRGGGEARQRKLMEAEDITFIGDRVARGHRWQAGLED